MLITQKIGRYMSCLRLPLAVLAFTALLVLASWLRHLSFTSEFLLFSYLQTVGSLLSFTYAANALVRFRGTHDRLTLMLALGFVLAGIIETLAVFSFYGQLSVGPDASRVPMAWMVGRTLLAVLLLAALVVERRVPHSREPGREIAVAFIVVGGVAYLTSAAYFGSLIQPAVYPAARFSRPWDLLPAALFLLAALGFGRRLRVVSSVFDRVLLAALWMNVACHLVISQSVRSFDAPFMLAQILKVTSYALVLGGALLDNARLFDQVRHLAVSDSLTGLGNYRKLISVLEAEIQRSRRTGRSFAVLLMDLDGLKAINDRHGHLVGSRAICRLGNVLRVHSRGIDTAARYGGDEFALVLPEAGGDAAKSVGDRICERLLADAEWPKVSVSVGAAVFPQDGETIEQLLDAADRALYGMKRRESRVLSLTRIAACL
jgi:diguanylate cyclase (GGDEF)-like protein